MTQEQLAEKFNVSS
ncbi:MAG: hypothetical protein MJZ22_02935, partial [Candidatus Saccharibacteria bacterium]|nr:hypothetical protein [Candidatus Saccharibacteria bacterium]